jgi:plastocyanin
MSLTRHLQVALIATGAALAASPMAAQSSDPSPIQLGRTIDGTLGRTDPTLNEKGRFRVYRFDAKANQRYSIIMRADAFDSFLSIARNVSGLTDYIATDDDGAGNSNARLRWTAKTAGQYFLVAQSLKEDGLGDFTIRLDTAPAIIVVPPRMVAMGEAMNGELAETDPMVDGKGAYFDLYKIQARRGQKLQIEMTAADFDSFVGIGRMNGDSLTIDETDDDGAGERNARLRYTVKEDGEYIIRAQALDANGSGAYTVKVTERVTRTSVPVAVIANTAMAGELTETDEEADDGTYFDLYKLTVRANETITVVMRSTAVDSYVVLGKMVDGEFEQLATDDDGAGGRNARLEHTFDDAGEYVIRANTVGSDKLGRYTIRVERAAAGGARRRASSGPSQIDGRASATDSAKITESVSEAPVVQTIVSPPRVRRP